MLSKYQKITTYSHFGGIDVRKSHSDKNNIYDINNFRITSDGSLEKRYGFSCICSLPSNILAIWSGLLEEKYRCFIVQGNSLCLLNTHSKALSIVGQLNDFQGRPSFFFYRDSLYLYAAPQFYKVTPNSLTTVLGYVPLYADNWETTYAGKINEPLNLLNGYARLTYTVPEEHYSILLPLGEHIVKSIVWLYKNGELLSPDRYYIDTDYNAIRVPNLVPGDKFSACVIFDIDEQKRRLLSSTNQAVFGGINNCRLFMWGGASKSTMYASSFVSNENLAVSESFFNGCSSLYFPEHHEFTVGDGRHPITSVLRHYDRLLIFTTGDTYMADTSACGLEEFPVMNINSSVGCYSQQGSTTIKNSPITLWDNDVYCWTSDTDELNECNAYSISEQLGDCLSSEFLKGAGLFKNDYQNEIWLYNKSFGDYIWIYNTDKKAWYKFSGISATGFFDADGDVGFFDDNRICKFSKDYYYDMQDDYTNSEITAQLTIKNLNFGDYSKKRLTSFAVYGESECGEIEFTFIPNIGDTLVARLTQEREHSYVKRRVYSGRFSIFKTVTVRAIPKRGVRHVIHAFEILGVKV